MFTNFSHSHIDYIFRNQTSLLIEEALDNSDWMGLIGLLDKCANGDPVVYQAINELTSYPGYGASFVEFKNKFPNSTWPDLFLAQKHVGSAWEARGYGYSSSVSDSAYEEFYNHLNAARNILESILLDRPRCLFSLLSLLSVESVMVENGDLSECEQIFNRIRQVDDDNFIAHKIMLTLFSAKWHGSNKEMFQFAKNAAAGTKGHNRLYGLMAIAFSERWLAFDFEIEKSAERKSKRAAMFHNESVRSTLRKAYKAACPQWLSVEQFNSDDAEIMNHFAFCFYQAGDYEMCQQVMDRIGSHWTAQPWSYMHGLFTGKPTTSQIIDKARKQVGHLPRSLMKPLILSAGGLFCVSLAAVFFTSFN